MKWNFSFFGLKQFDKGSNNTHGNKYCSAMHIKYFSECIVLLVMILNKTISLRFMVSDNT